MLNRYGLEVMVGSFMLIALAAIVFLALKVSGLSTLGTRESYTVKAYFDNIGDLRVRAPVTIAGVKVGQVDDISLDTKTYRGIVILRMKQEVALPGDSTASILTQGLLGSNYISLTPGFEDDALMTDGDVISETHPAIILENLIGKLMFGRGEKKSKQ